ncbi:MAG: M48 family metalloprotease [Thermoleophilaceae bacterium]|nr:M48 family metalloprotease [Thermoleophilaceae bacterium]
MNNVGTWNRLAIGWAAVGLAAIALGITGALHALTLAAPMGSSWLEACGQLLLSPRALLTAGLVAVLTLSMTGLLRGLAPLRRYRTMSRVLRREHSSAQRLDVDGVQISILPGEAPRAFCTGLLRPRIYLSAGAIARLTSDQLRAVVAHENHHLRRRDPLRLLLLATLGRALFLLPAIGQAGERSAALAEVEADAAAVRKVGQRRHLAAALLAFAASPSVAADLVRPVGVLAIAPQRVDALAGRPPRFEERIGLFAASSAAVILIGAVGLLAAVSPRASLSVPLLLAQSCMLLMLLISLGGLLVLLVRRARGPSLLPR